MIKQLMSAHGFELSPLQENQFIVYKNLLQEWNKVMNLTAIDDDEGIYQRHFIDSSLLLQAIDIKPDDKVIDVGTGAGFPGLPIAILTGCQMTLLDALNKRIKFLNAVCSDAHIGHVDCVHGRAEDLAQNREYREHFDYVVARAVANLTVLLEYTIPFIKVGGALVAHKATKTEEELTNAQYALKKLGCSVEKVLPLNDGTDRTLIVIRKMTKTPKMYPRKAGIPVKKPLSGK